MDTALVVINGSERLTVQERLDIGRSDNPDQDILGLDERDNGISRLSATIERGTDGWFVRNRSTKASLYLIVDASRQPFPLYPGERHLISSKLGIEIRGLVRTHRIDVLVESDPRSTGIGNMTGSTTFVGTIRYSEADRDALTAMFSGYLLPFPRRDPRPVSYAEAAKLLGVPASTVRRRIEKIRERLRSVDIYIEGRHAAADLAEFVLGANVIGPEDLARLDLPD